jgi:ribosomal protein L32
MNEVLAICQECGERSMRGYLLCSGCCAHEDVETTDEADGREGSLPHEWVSRCKDCGETVVWDGEGWQVL